ncbi:hypothetical protein [Rhizobium sp. BK491]|uniref:hypothetical protein n=1 Tax=Rhizobium sp. BK491 TaxID=2587009 RepID=UPI00160D36FB|nr:hypothetical protein [Rhizobium sp. BK491]MBB3571272.1 hypothetical protein [Rhizobium sp. BK491]
MKTRANVGRVAAFGIGTAVIALLAANLMIARMTIDISPDISGPAASGDSSKLRSVTQAAPAIGSEFSETIARPIFSPTRREFAAAQQLETPPPPAETIAPPVIKKPVLVLQGTRWIDGKTTALIKLESSPNPDWYSVGQVIDAWQISLIDTNRLVLSHGEERAEYALYSGEILGQR